MPYCAGIPEADSANNCPPNINYTAIPDTRLIHQMSREDMRLTYSNVLRLRRSIARAGSTAPSAMPGNGPGFN